MDEKLDYFIKRTDQRLQRIEDTVGRIEKFKGKIIGGSVVLSVLAGLIVKWIFN